MATKTIDQSWVRIPASYAGKDRDRGELIPRFAMKNEDRLKRLDYIKDWEPPTGWEAVKCPECGSEFTERGFFEGHFERRHSERIERLPVQQDGESSAVYADRVAAWKERQDDIEAQKQERYIAQMPPDLTKTMASTRG